MNPSLPGHELFTKTYFSQTTLATVRELAAATPGTRNRVVDLLRAAGCGFVQGYLLGRPSPPEQVLQALSVT